MVRRGYVLPRLSVLLAVLLLIAVAIPPSVHWSAVRSAKRLTGANIEVGHVHTSPGRSMVVLKDLQAADPNHPTKNLFEADRVELPFDPAALLRRKFVVERGVVRGFRIGTDRQSPGPTPYPSPFAKHRAHGESFAGLNMQFFETAAAMLLEDPQKSFKSIERAREISQRWPREHEQLAAKNEQIEARLAGIRQACAAAGDNPLRNAEVYPRMTAELETLAHQIGDLRQEIHRWRQQLQDDKQALAEAKRQDQQWLQSRRPSTQLDGQELTEYFLGRELSQRMATVVEWLQWGRKRLPSSPAADKPAARGTDVLFAGVEQVPNVLLKSIVLHGEGTFGGQQMTIQGVVKRLSSHPTWVAEPTEVTIQTVDGPTMLIHAVLDARGKMGHDVVTISMPQMVLSQVMLGEADRLALSVAPGRAHLWMQVEMTGNALQGELVLKQDRPKLTPLMSAEQAPLAPLVRRAVGQVKQLEAHVKLSGHVHQPQWELVSNLGPELAAALSQAVTDQVIARNGAVLQANHREVDQLWVEIEAAVQEHSRAALAQLDASRLAIDQLEQTLVARRGTTDRVLEQDSPLRTIMRR